MEAAIDNQKIPVRFGTRPSPHEATGGGSGRTLPSSEMEPSGLRTASGTLTPQLLNGYGSEKFLIQSVLGVGGMGVVYRAKHALLNCDVALKVVRPEYAQSPEVVERFFREARALSALNAPGIVRVLDCDVTADGCPFIAMELLEGQDLRTVLDKQGALSVNKALGVVHEAARAMAHAHAAGIVHRDLKPENLFLDTRTGHRPAQVKVIDFGVVRNFADTHSITIIGSALGSVYYMAPEQIEDSHAADERSDVWSLGVILYECLTGELPFQARSALAVSNVILTSAPKDVRILCPLVPDAVAELVHRCLDKNPARRFANARELADALWRSGAKLRGSPQPQSSVPVPRMPPLRVPYSDNPSRPPPRVSQVVPVPLARRIRPAPPNSTSSVRASSTRAALRTSPAALLLLCVFTLSLGLGAALVEGTSNAGTEQAQLLSTLGRSFIAIAPK